jgi:hypothetical protein
MLNLSRLPAAIADSTRFYIDAGLSLEEAVVLATDDMSPQGFIDADGTPYLSWSPSNSAEVECRMAYRRFLVWAEAERPFWEMIDEEEL